MLVASVTRLDSKCEQIVSRASGTRLDTIGRSMDSSIGSVMGSAMSSAMCSTVEISIGRFMGRSIGKGELKFVFELIETVVRSTDIFFSNCR